MENWSDTPRAERYTADGFSFSFFQDERALITDDGFFNFLLNVMAKDDGWMCVCFGVVRKLPLILMMVLEGDVT